MAIDKRNKAKKVSEKKEAKWPFEINLPASIGTFKVDEYNRQALQQMFETALNPIHLQSVTGRGLSLATREFDFENCLIMNGFVMDFFFTCGINTASGSIYNQIIQHNKLKSGYDFDELRNLFFNQMRKITIPDVEREHDYTHHIVRFASSVIKTWVMPSEAVTQPFKEFQLTLKQIDKLGLLVWLVWRSLRGMSEKYKRRSCI